jgi:hypothetical protein
MNGLLALSCNYAMLHTVLSNGSTLVLHSHFYRMVMQVYWVVHRICNDNNYIIVN